jgi:transposase-like protein
MTITGEIGVTLDTGPRGTVHQRRKLDRQAPTQAVEEIRTDAHELVDAEPLRAARQASRACLSTWRARAPQGVARLEEAGEDLLTCSRFPKSQWNSRRTPHASERFNGAFRRRVQTPGAWPTTQAAAWLLGGVVTSGPMRMRRLEGWRDLAPDAAEAAPRTA